ncbi:MAG: hypothetical protein ACI96M_003451, partial [Candidatus Azotimanducaceae bacterium]
HSRLGMRLRPPKLNIGTPAMHTPWDEKLA